MGHRLLAIAVVALVGGNAHADGGRVVGKVTVTEADGKAATADVIVYIVGYTEPGVGKATAQVAQKGRKFVPDLVAVTAGESVSFPNQDSFLHNVFSQSSARKFDLGSFKKGDTKEKDFTTAGVIDVYCNIHPEMAATILVLPNKRHTRTKPDGTFVIDGVKPGKWTVFAYGRRALKPASGTVTVTAGQDATVNLALTRGAEPPHVNKYGEKYKDPTTTYR
ncbi:MAG TPA: plastocyanin/azurin family copper-binding protein [Kofleriaceae bacterium]|nr:plastocyanin/azurin family copper-binding protein [Kofleriaceae bacterium]